MVEIHCYQCGGFISDPQEISHRRPPDAAHAGLAATPRSALCTCRPPVVYGPPPGRASTPQMKNFD
jgi:hypothetical protein